MWMEQQTLNYNRIAEAIAFIKMHFKSQPDLDAIAAHVHMSPFHFQRMFQEWAGTSPKKFLQFITLDHAKSLLHEKLSLQDTAMESGLSGTGRLHDLFVKIEAMTPAEYKNGGKDLTIKFSFAESLFGSVMIASTEKGVCHVSFFEDRFHALNELRQRFPNAVFLEEVDAFHKQAVQVFSAGKKDIKEIKLHLKGTLFQLKVWEALLKIPSGKVTSYGKISEAVGNPKASRAVGTAIGSNPVAFLIPCHRIITASGNVGGYMWGPLRKTIMLGWERAQSQSTQ